MTAKQLGIGHYLSPGGEGKRVFWGGDHLIFRRTKEGSVVTEDPKGGGGLTENFGRIQKEATQICLENEDMGGIAKVIKRY